MKKCEWNRFVHTPLPLAHSLLWWPRGGEPPPLCLHAVGNDDRVGPLRQHLRKGLGRKALLGCLLVFRIWCWKPEEAYVGNTLSNNCSEIPFSPPGSPQSPVLSWRKREVLPCNWEEPPSLCCSWSSTECLNPDVNCFFRSLVKQPAR